ncbi:MAG: PIN domain-containing protein [Terriglobia bacterium]
MTRPRRIRLFLDSNVLTGGMVSPWGLDKAVLSLCAAGIGRLVLAEVVREEVEENLLLHAGRLRPADADQLIEDYRRLITLCGPERVPFPDADRVRASRHLIRHAADVPVLLSALDCRPDWLLTHNTKHFSEMVAKRTGLRISTPSGFFRTFAALLQ